MIESKNDASRNLEKALQALEQAKQRVANEKKKQNEKKRKAENHHKYIMGGIIVKYFPDCYSYDEPCEILYAPIQATYKESQSLKGLAKMKYDKEHKDSLSKYPELKERMQSLLQNGEKITPKQWKAEIQSLQSEYDSIGREQTKTATELAYAEVISYNRKNLERELQNESRQRNR